MSIIKAGSKKLMSNYLAFAKNLGINKVVIVIVYVDNFLFFGPHPTKINIIKSLLDDQYQMKDLGSYEQFTRSSWSKIWKKRLFHCLRMFLFKKLLSILIG